jgi:ankyrin repeat protein
MDLWEAVEKNKPDVVAKLLSEGAEPNQKRGKRHILHAVPHGADEVKSLLLEAGAWSSDCREDTVWAANLGRPAVLQAMLEQGADPNVEALMGRPVSVAARRGDLESVRLLLDAGADPNVSGRTTTVFSEALEGDHTEVVLLLLQHGAAPDLEPQWPGARALQLAAMRGHLRVVRKLVERGASINYRPTSVVLPAKKAPKPPGGGLAALRDLVSGETGTLLKNLFSANTDEANAAGQALLGKFGAREESAAQTTTVGGLRTWSVDHRAYTPETAHDASALCLAARQGHAEVVDYLLEAGADPNAQDGEGLTPRQWAERNEHASVLEVFARRRIEDRKSPDQRLLEAALDGDLEAAVGALDDGANVHARDQRRAWRRCTPLLLAAESGSAELVHLLLQRGADPAAHDGEGQKPNINHREGTAEQLRGMGMPLGRNALHRACAAGHAPMVRLLAHGPLGEKDFFGATPLALALEGGHSETARELLQAGAVPEHADLLAALEAGHIDMVAALLERVKPKREALLCACQWGDADLVRLLLKHGADAKRATKDKGPLAYAVAAKHYATPDNPDGALRVVRKAPRGSSTLVPLPEERILAVVDALLDAGADPEAPGYQGTPLQHVVSSGYVRVAERLIQAGGRVTAAIVRDADRFGHTALAKFLESHVGAAEPARRPKSSRKKADTQGPNVPVPDFSEAGQRPEFQAALRELRELCGSEPVEMSELPGCYRLHVLTERQGALDVEQVQQRFLVAGALVLKTDALSQQNWAVYPTQDPSLVVAAWQTNGCNVDVGTGYILQWLHQLQEQCPLRFITVSTDTIEARFLGELPPADALAKSIYRLCPDVVTQGVGTVKQLAKDLATSKRLYLWWD